MLFCAECVTVANMRQLYVKVITKDGIRDEEWIDEKPIMPA